MKSLFNLLFIMMLISTASLLHAEDMDDPIDQLNHYMSQLNLQLKSEGANYQVVLAEALTGTSSDYMGISVVAKDVGNKHLESDFVPGDSRRTQSGANVDEITYAIDSTDAVPFLGGLSATQTTDAIQRAMNTWDTQQCSTLGLSQNADFGLDIGVVAFLNGFGGSPYIFADIQHAGWRDINFSGNILAVTFTFSFIDTEGNFTDVDNNSKNDTFFREIYYDPSVVWSVDGVSGVDVESVALHEIGHGLSQGHFGTISFKKGVLSAKPKAVMNAIYTGAIHNLKGTDKGGHCSNWASWPNQ